MINKRAGGMGLISGRKAFQKPMEGVRLLNAIQDVYLPTRSVSPDFIAGQRWRRSASLGPLWPMPCHHHDLVACHGCDLLQRLPADRVRGRVRCRRCGCVLHHQGRDVVRRRWAGLHRTGAVRAEQRLTR